MIQSSNNSGATTHLESEWVMHDRMVLGTLTAAVRVKTAAWGCLKIKEPPICGAQLFFFWVALSNNVKQGINKQPAFSEPFFHLTRIARWRFRPRSVIRSRSCRQMSVETPALNLLHSFKCSRNAGSALRPVRPSSSFGVSNTPKLWGSKALIMVDSIAIYCTSNKMVVVNCPVRCPPFGLDLRQDQLVTSRPGSTRNAEHARSDSIQPGLHLRSSHAIPVWHLEIWCPVKQGRVLSIPSQPKGTAWPDRESKSDLSHPKRTCEPRSRGQILAYHQSLGKSECLALPKQSWVEPNKPAWRATNLVTHKALLSPLALQVQQEATLRLILLRSLSNRGAQQAHQK